VRKALRIPCYTIAANAGVDAHEVVTRVMQEHPNIGYDALHSSFVDMMKAGIIDPTKVCSAIPVTSSNYNILNDQNLNTQAGRGYPVLFQHIF